MESKPNASQESGLHREKLVHLALPVRWSFVGREGRGHAEMACTYDIHRRGARLLSAREVSVGDLVLMERGRNKAICQVVWTADSASPLRGQFTVQCVEEGKTPWDEELRQMEERYQPIIFDGGLRRSDAGKLGQGDKKRRRPRFYVEGQAEVIDGVQRVEGEVRQISEYGARIAVRASLRPGADFRLMLNVFNLSVALKAQVRYLADNLGMGVEFQEIRLGDRPLLSHVLSRLSARRVEEFARVDVVTGPLVAAAG